MNLKIFDLFFIALAVAVIALFSLRAYGMRGDALQVMIETGSDIFIYSLDDDRDVSIAGPLGDTIVRITNRAVLVEASPCRDKLCIASGKLFRGGDWTACLPNRVFVRIEGASREEVDALSF